MELGGAAECLWLSDHQRSSLPLGLGQYVNDGALRSNVAYCELSLPWSAEWLRLRHLLPFAYWSSTAITEGDIMMHCTALVTTRKARASIDVLV